MGSYGWWGREHGGWECRFRSGIRVGGFVVVGNWEVGHIQYVTSQLLRVRFQLEKVRLVGLGFKKINPLVLN